VVKLTAKKLLIAILLLSLVTNLFCPSLALGQAAARPSPSPSSLTPEEAAATVELLRACNKAYDSCERQQALKDKLIKSQDEQINTLSKQVESLKDADSGILNHKATWFGLGFLAALAAAFVSRK
jgi:hypothetical protein